MGGYMGFGMQKWIYSRNLRRQLYMHDRILSFTSLPKYSRNFTIKPKIKEHPKLKGILIIFIVFSVALIGGVNYKNFISYSNRQTVLVNDFSKLKDKKAFNFLLNSGKGRIYRNDIVGAYSELKLAYKIDSTDKELNQLIIETLSILCSQNNEYCNELDLYMDNYERLNLDE